MRDGVPPRLDIRPQGDVDVPVLFILVDVPREGVQMKPGWAAMYSDISTNTFSNSSGGQCTVKVLTKVITPLPVAS